MKMLARWQAPKLSLTLTNSDGNVFSIDIDANIFHDSSEMTSSPRMYEFYKMKPEENTSKATYATTRGNVTLIKTKGDVDGRGTLLLRTPGFQPLLVVDEPHEAIEKSKQLTDIKIDLDMNVYVAYADGSVARRQWSPGKQEFIGNWTWVVFVAT
jgi:hypothetical protein